MAGVQAGNRAGCFEVAAQLGVVDSQPAQMAEGSFQLISQPDVFAAEPGIVSGLLLATA